MHALYLAAESAVIIVSGIVRMALLPLETLWRRVQFIFSDPIFFLAATIGPLALIELGAREKTTEDVVVFVAGNILILGLLSIRDIVRWRKKRRHGDVASDTEDLLWIRSNVKRRIYLMLIVSWVAGTVVAEKKFFDDTTLVILFFLMKACIEVTLSIGRRYTARK